MYMPAIFAKLTCQTPCYIFSRAKLAKYSQSCNYYFGNTLPTACILCIVQEFLASPNSDFSFIIADSPHYEHYPNKMKWKFVNGHIYYYSNNYVFPNSDVGLIMMVEGCDYNHEHVEILMKHYIEK